MINFRPPPHFLREIAENELEKHYQRLISISYSPGNTHHFRSSDQHYEYPGYYSVDVLGDELKWMNETFPKEKYTWYLWFESVFLIPEEMAVFLRLRWS